MIVVSDTSPIVNLAAIGQLHLLWSLYEQVYIPQSVHDEIVITGAGQPGAREVDTLDWIETRRVTDPILFASLQVELDTDLRSVLDDLIRKAGFWISQELYEHALKIAGEL